MSVPGPAATQLKPFPALADDDTWWWRCHCALMSQGGRPGLMAHQDAIHKHLTLEGCKPRPDLLLSESDHRREAHQVKE